MLGEDGVRYLDSGQIEGTDPLAPFGPNAAAHVSRTDGFPHCPDIVVNSTYWAESDEVAAFEELVGSHGGMGGGQAHPFALYPSELARAGGARGRRRDDAPPHAPLARRPRPRRLRGLGADPAHQTSRATPWTTR